MKHPVYEALRHNGTTYRPPGEVELDPKRDAADIRRLTRKGVIGAPLGDAESAGQQGTVQPNAASAAQAGGDAQADESAKANADDATPEQDGVSAAEEKGAEVAPEPEAKPEAKPKAASKPAAKAKE